jgi:hypothetical protein
MLKLTFNNDYRMANCTMHGEPGTAAAFRHGESGARRRQGALVRGAWPLPLDGDERRREFTRMEFSVMCNGCNGRTANKTGHHKFWGRLIIRGRSRPPSTTHGEASGGFNPNGACNSCQLPVTHRCHRVNACPRSASSGRKFPRSCRNHLPERGWIHEIKYDGYRTLIVIDCLQVALSPATAMTGRQLYRRVVDACCKLACKTTVLDGEVVVQDEKGLTDFDAPVLPSTQRRTGSCSLPSTYCT